MNTLLIIDITISLVLSIPSAISFGVIYQLLSHLCCSRKTKDPNTSTTNAPKEEKSSTSKSKPNSSKSGSTDLNTKSVNQTDKSQHTIAFFKRTTITSCILFSIVCVCINIDRILLIFYNRKTLTFMIAVPIWSFYFIGHLVLSLIFIGRLHFTFKGSPFSYSKCQMAFLKITWTSMPLFAVFSMVSYYIAIWLVIGFGVLFVLIDILLSIVLLYLYLKKLFDLVSNFGHANKQLILLMTRYTILYSICWISTIVIFILLAFTPMFATNGYQEFVWIFVSIDCVLNVICLCLNMSFAKSAYDKWCKYAHIKCQDVCNKCINKSSTDENMICVQIDNNKKKMKKENEKRNRTLSVETESNTAVIM